jgi:dTMP kinase
MDLGISRDWFESYLRYQKRMAIEFKRLAERYKFITINGNRSISAVDRDLRVRIEQVLDRDYPVSCKG